MKALIELSDNEDGSLHIEAGAKKDGIHDDNSQALTAYDAAIKFVRLLGTENGPELMNLVDILMHPEELEEVTVDGIPSDSYRH